VLGPWVCGVFISTEEKYLPPPGEKGRASSIVSPALRGSRLPRAALRPRSRPIPAYAQLFVPQPATGVSSDTSFWWRRWTRGKSRSPRVDHVSVEPCGEQPCTLPRAAGSAEIAARDVDGRVGEVRPEPSRWAGLERGAQASSGALGTTFRPLAAAPPPPPLIGKAGQPDARSRRAAAPYSSAAPPLIAVDRLGFVPPERTGTATRRPCAGGGGLGLFEAHSRRSPRPAGRSQERGPRAGGRGACARRPAFSRTGRP